jgi:hypothetical protein
MAYACLVKAINLKEMISDIGLDTRPNSYFENTCIGLERLTNKKLGFNLFLILYLKWA